MRRGTVRREAGTRSKDLTCHLGGLDPSQCIFRHVTKTSRAVAALYNEAFDASGMTGHQFNLMMTLHRAGPLTVGALARLVGMDSSTVPRAVGPLVKQSLVTIATGEDRRERIITLTAAGERRLAAAAPAWATVQKRLIEHIGEASWQQMVVALKSIREGASRAGSGGTNG